MNITLKNQNGLSKNVKVGFSWTTFFFGFLPALFRGDSKWAAIMLISELVVGSFTFGIGATIIGIIFSFIYNKIYIKDLIEKGYAPSTEEAKNLLIGKEIISVN